MEGPSIVILKEEARLFKGKKIIRISGNSKIDQQRLLNQKVIAFKSWGKHFLICFKAFSLRIHFLMFGSYRINQRKSAPLRLSFLFENGELNIYSCSVKLIEENLNEIYDWQVDVMSKDWNPKKAVSSLKKLKKTMICDALLDQQIFSGSGNIIKNEVLFREKLHPETMVEALSPQQVKSLVDAVWEYSFDFYRWKKIYQLRKHWQIYTKKKCPRCDLPVIKKYTGKGKRRSFFCTNCQVLIKAKKKAIVK
jgi:endonuclease-8